MVDNDASDVQRPEPLTEEEIERWLVEFDPTSANIRRLIADLRTSRAEVERLQSLQDCKRCGDWNE